jgi:hypothetical protein
MSTRDQDEQGKTDDTDDTEDTEGHVYVPKDERAGGIAGLPAVMNRVGPISEDDDRPYG